MKLNIVLAGAFLAAFTGSALSIGANQDYYIFHDMGAKKCSVVKEKPTTGAVGTGEIFTSEEAAKTAMEKIPECAKSGT